MSTIESPVLVLNPHVPLAQTAEPQRPKVDVPGPVRTLLEAHVFTDADGGDVHPPAVPPNAPIGADVPDFEAIGVLERRQPVRHGARRRRVARGRGRLVERLMRALVIELLAKEIEASLLRGEPARRRTRRLRLQGAVHAVMPAVLRRFAGLDAVRQASEPD